MNLHSDLLILVLLATAVMSFAIGPGQFRTFLRRLGVMSLLLSGHAHADQAFSAGMDTNMANTLLRAISQVESGDNDKAVGKAGEVSRFQILPSVWRQYSRSRAYHHTPTAHAVAMQHLARLRFDHRESTGIEPTLHTLAVEWQCGLSGYQRLGFNPRRLSKPKQDRARRIMNLVEAQRQN